MAEDIQMEESLKSTVEPETDKTSKGRPPVVALFTLAAVIVLNLISDLVSGRNWGLGVYVSFIEIPLVVAFVLSMIFRTRALGLSMASAISVIGALLGTPILLVSTGTSEERIVVAILLISIWTAAIITVVSYCRLDRRLKNSFTRYVGIALPFGVWLLIWGLSILSEIAF